MQTSRVILLSSLAGILLLSACATPQAEPTAGIPATATVPATETLEPTAAPTATEFPEIEPGLRRLTSLEEFQQHFNSNQGESRLVLLLSSGCPSCVVGAEWIQANIVDSEAGSETQVYAIWFPTVVSGQLPSEVNPLWDPDALEAPSVISYWDSQGLVSQYFAQNVDIEGIERSTVPQTFGGLQWGSHVWDVAYLFSPEAQWGDDLSDPVLAGYPILETRTELVEALAVQPGDKSSAVTAGLFEIDPDRSVASYRVQETLLGQRTNLAVGFTSEINGSIELDPENLDPLVLSPIEVDISALQSDNFLRDQRIRNEFLESAAFPLAVFTPQEMIGLPDEVQPGESVSFEIRGILDVRETEVPTVFMVTARLEGDEIVGHAESQVLMTDFGFEPPAIGEIIAAENEVGMKVDFVAVRRSP